MIALIDCNSFYCSCERLFQPALRGKPVGVLSNNDGCFVSRTKELKALDVPMGAPYFKFKDLCKKNNVHVFSANFSLYTNISSRVMSVLSQFSPNVEIYSVDEAFLDLSGFDIDQLKDYAINIKNTVERNTGIPVSVGIAKTKVLAKAANNFAKKKTNTGVCVLNETDKIDYVLKNTPINDVWGIGRKNSAKMINLGIRSAYQLKYFHNEKLIKRQFTVVGESIQKELQQVSKFELELKPEKKKQIMSSRTFGKPVFDLQSLMESVAIYTCLAAEKLRNQDSKCRKISVWARTNPHKNVPQFYAHEEYISLSPTSDSRKLVKYAWSVLEKLYKEGYEYKKASISLDKIEDNNRTQMSLFEENDTDTDNLLMELIDKINKRNGPGTIKLGACGTNNKAWLMRQTKLSQRYVTGWNSLSLVKC